MNAEDREIFEKAKPFLRSILAFSIFIHFGDVEDLDTAYLAADKFITFLEMDLK